MKQSEPPKDARCETCKNESYSHHVGQFCCRMGNNYSYYKWVSIACDDYEEEKHETK